MEKQKANIYVDGSYNPTTNKIGCAFALFIDASKKPHRVAFSKQLKSQQKYGSSIAEMTAVKKAIKTARSLGITQINIYYDWNGLELFSHRNNIKQRHNACPSYAAYADYIENARNDARICFIKVKAHSGDELNSLVDRIARAI
jgi:ribonuclease H-related protein